MQSKVCLGRHTVYTNRRSNSNRRLMPAWFRLAWNQVRIQFRAFFIAFPDEGGPIYIKKDFSPMRGGQSICIRIHGGGCARNAREQFATRARLRPAGTSRSMSFYLLTYLLTHLTNKQEHDLKKVPRTAPFFSNKRVRPETAECQSRCYSINCLFLELHMFFLMLQFLWRSYNSPVRLLCYTILYYTILCYAMLCYDILYFTLLYCTILCYAILYYTILY